MLSRLSSLRKFSTITLKPDTNQAYALGKYAIDFLKQGEPSPKVNERVKLFHIDSIICGLSAIALKTNAPTILREEALETARRTNSFRARLGYARLLASIESVIAEKAIIANSAAIREWDSNGTVFGYNPDLPGHQAGEFGHNDYYPVVMAACQQHPLLTGRSAIKGMILIDEIRGRLAEVFSLKTYKIDHVVHGAIASVAVYGALLGATAEQIEHAIGMFIAHYVPYRAIRAGKQLSDSKGASAGISSEAAILCINRAMNGFIGPKDIFRNPEAIFRLNEPTEGNSPFELVLGMKGDDFSVMRMHFKLGLYEHQSAGAIEGILKLLIQHKFLEYNNPDCIIKIKIIAYQPAYGIIGDPAKRNPTTRQSADHSMIYIKIKDFKQRTFENLDELWKLLILEPKDYAPDAIFNKTTRILMEKVVFEHGGEAYDKKYPEGIPTSVQITLRDGKVLDSGLVMFPSGHSGNQTANLKNILQSKFRRLGQLCLKDEELEGLLKKLNKLEQLSNSELQTLYHCKLKYTDKPIDSP